MSSTLALARAEVRRLGRNKRYSIFSIGLPVVLYLVIAPSVKNVHVYGVAYPAYYMIAMASIGAFSSALTGNAQRISQERKDGWVRQLRLTALPANAYVIAKIAASMVITVPSIVIVLLLGRFYGGVHMELWKWFAVGGTIWIGIATADRVAFRRSRILGGREWVRLGAAELALDCLRRFLQGLPVAERIDFEKI